MKPQIVLLCFFICFSIENTRGQNPIKLKNASFEADRPSCCSLPSEWVDLGVEDQTPPDIQPGFFQVLMQAQNGLNYIGLVVRENNTWEGLGQRLSDVLKKDSSYTFSLWLSRSNVYKSATRLSTELSNFNSPTILKIWGYNTKNKQEELLAESLPVSHSKWVRYEFVLNPTLTDYNELDLMAYYAPGYEKTNGNLLIDDCSSIVKIEGK